MTAADCAEREDLPNVGPAIHELGLVAFEVGPKSHAIPLTAIAFVINDSMGNTTAESDLETVLSLCTQLRYSREQVEQVFVQAAEADQRDRGDRLIREAFGE